MMKSFPQDFFFVPTLARPAVGGFTGDIGRYHRHTGSPYDYWNDVLKYISTTWPFWDASGGSDHVFVMMGDHGGYI